MYQVICILMMVLATILPRVLPITFFNKKIKSKFIKNILYYVPYAVLTALTFPSILYCVDNFYIALIGTLCALLLSILNQKLVIVALSSVAIIYILELIL